MPVWRDTQLTFVQLLTTNMQAYTDKMNAVLARLRESSENKHLAKMGIDKLLQNLDSIVDEADRATIRNKYVSTVWASGIYIAYVCADVNSCSFVHST